MHKKENNVLVHQAIAVALIKLYRNCMPKTLIIQIIQIFFDPLIKIISSGKSKVIQKAACYSLKQFILEIDGNKELIDAICPKFIKLFIVLNQ